MVTEAVNYLLGRKYGIISTLVPTFASLNAYKKDTVITDKAAEIKEYENKLRKMPVNELLALHKQSLIDDENSRFYNLKSANADFEHWSKAAYWTLEEAIALSFGKQPDIVTWKALEQYKQKSAFVRTYAKRRDLALRATHWKKFGDTIPPVIFIDWCKQLKIELPNELVSELAKVGCTATNWYDEYQKLKNVHDELSKQQLKNPVNITKPESTRKIDNLLQAIAGIAIYGYKHDVNSARSNASQDLSDDISKTGKTIDTKTIRGWIKEGIDLLPAKQNKR